MCWGNLSQQFGNPEVISVSMCLMGGCARKTEIVDDRYEKSYFVCCWKDRFSSIQQCIDWNLMEV